MILFILSPLPKDLSGLWSWPPRKLIQVYFSSTFCVVSKTPQFSLTSVSFTFKLWVGKQTSASWKIHRSVKILESRTSVDLQSSSHFLLLRYRISHKGCLALKTPSSRQICQTVETLELSIKSKVSFFELRKQRCPLPNPSRRKRQSLKRSVRL